ncbi:MAG TPA: hypothetical protein VKU41_16510 [Polyangiaceae bacterium]|nr:hypothetical protein [Polyangiaceae bacterium]
MRFTAAAVGGAVLLVTTGAAANGRYPASSAILLSPTDPDLVVGRATFGTLVSHDHGKTFDFLCDDAIGLSPQSTQDPVLGLTAAGALVAGFDAPAVGLDVSSDTGCNWTCVGGPLAGQAVVDLAVRPDAPHDVVLLTGSGADAGAALSQVYESADDGAHWTALGTPIDPTATPTTLDVAPGDARRLYVSATRGFGSARSASLFVSTDDAMTWTERPTPFDPNADDAIYIGAVDPTDPMRVYLRTSGSPSRLFVTTDGGQSFQVASIALTGTMQGFALSPDGATIYAGGPADGLFAAARADLTFHKMAALHVQCLAARASEVWACSDEPSGFIVGVSTDQGATFAAALHLNGIAGALACAARAGGVACGADANASQCGGDSFVQFCQDLGGCAPGALATPSARSSRGCSLGRGAGVAAGVGAGAVALVVVIRRRRGDFRGRRRARRPLAS